MGVEGLLRDKTRKPGKAPIAAAQAAELVALTCTEPPHQATHWTGRAMAKAMGLSLGTADEADALAGEGADHELRRAVVPKGPACRVDPRVSADFRDDPPAPYRLQQIVLGDDAVAVRDEERQRIEDLGFERNQLVAAA